MEVAPLKVVIVGDAACGKTSLLSSLLANTYPSDYTPTVSEEHALNMMVDGKPVTLNLYDTAG